MATYTMTLRAIVDHYSQDQPFLPVKDKIEIGRQKLFDFDYPFYDENKRADFETKFIRNYYMREIGHETEYLFKFHLETWLFTNMEYWNKRFTVNELEYNPLSNAKRTTKSGKSINENENINSVGSFDRNNTSNFDRNNTKEETSNVTTDTTADDFIRNIYSETPENRLQLTSNPDGSGTVEYATNITENKETENSNSNVNGNKSVQENADGTQSEQIDGTQSSTSDRGKSSNENTWYETDGKIGIQSYQKMVKEYHDSLINIESELFNSMGILFMLVY